MAKVAMNNMKEINYKEFIESWRKTEIYEVQSPQDKLIGKDVRGQSDNPQGYRMVYCIVPKGKPDKSWWQFWKR